MIVPEKVRRRDEDAIVHGSVAGEMRVGAQQALIGDEGIEVNAVVQVGGKIISMPERVVSAGGPEKAHDMQEQNLWIGLIIHVGKIHTHGQYAAERRVQVLKRLRRNRDLKRIS